MRRLAALALLLPLAACGGGGDDPVREPEPTSLAETCPQLEAGLMDAQKSSVTPRPAEAESMLGVVRRLMRAGDQETMTALDFMVEPLEALADDPAPGRPTIDASAALDAAVLTVADRCEAVGSSAFQ